MELHPATLWEALADELGDRPALVQEEVRRTWAQFDDRAARLAGVLAAHGLGAGARVGLLLFNSPEFVEAYFGALKLRAVPFNVNYRYTGHEVAYLLDNAEADALVYHARLAPVVAGALAQATARPLLLEVDDGAEPLDGSLPYEEALAGADPAPRIRRHPDDVTMVYTGGTTGMPKGVVLKVGPGLSYLLESIPPLLGQDPVQVERAPAMAAALEPGQWMVSVPAPPLIHNTALGVGVSPCLATGGTIVLLPEGRFDPAVTWDTVADEQVNALTVVGDPFARPLLAELERGPARDLGALRTISSSGAMFSAEVRAGLCRHLPALHIIDVVASTEGTMGLAISSARHPMPTGRFRPGPGVLVLDDRDAPVGPGGTGRVALPGGAERYHRDEARSAVTFPVIDGRRYTIPGDHARVEDDGTLTLLGRGSSVINTGGEKVFAEEVEEVLKAQPGVEDALVFGVDDERLGQCVAAVLSGTAGVEPDLEDILAGARGHLAGYKLPRRTAVVDQVPRTPVGKPDYPAARQLLGH
jgi:fatty-acyl-CoA synthase